ncbi:MAG: response regulator [Pseudomonadota bacterium]
MRLLLVEDDPMIGESIRTGLRNDGFTVDWARDGRQAEAVLGNEPYALLLLDLGLPDKSGLDLLQCRDAVGDRHRAWHPPAERARVFDRFHRVRHPAVGGNGLGLAIVCNIAQCHRVEIRPGDGPKQTELSAEVVFSGRIVLSPD